MEAKCSQAHNVTPWPSTDGGIPTAKVQTVVVSETTENSLTPSSGDVVSPPNSTEGEEVTVWKPPAKKSLYGSPEEASFKEKTFTDSEPYPPVAEKAFTRFRK